MKSQFPLRLSLVVFIVTLTLFGGQIYLLQQAYNELERIQSTEFPLLQELSSSLRMIERSGDLLVDMTHDHNLANQSDYENLKDIYSQTFEQAQILQKQSVINDLPIESIAPDKVFAGDKIVIELLRQKKWVAAENEYSRTVAPQLEKTRNDLSQLTFQLSTRHEGKLATNNRSFLIFLVSSFLAVACFVVLWSFVFFSYRKNQKTLIEVERELEAERVRSIQSVKLSALGEMAGGVAHEINNPLAIIRGLAELHQRRIKSGKVDLENIQLGFDKILKTIDRMAKIVNSLRTFARDGSKDLFEEIEIKLLVDEVLSFSAEKIRNREIDLRINIPEGLTCDCRQVQIEQVLLNLLNNSLDAINEIKGPKWIQIEAFRINTSVRIQVTDCGSGIAPEIAEKIMSPFFTTKEIGKGTGLGLSVSTGIARMHGGSLSYDKHCPNTRFVLEIPHKHTQKTAEAS